MVGFKPTGTDLALPIAIDNKFTYYHCHAEVTQGTNTYTGTAAFTVETQDFMTMYSLIKTKTDGVPYVV